MMREYLILHMIALLCGIWFDVLFGDPHDIPHPIRAIGALISALEKRLNAPRDPGESKQKTVFKGFLLWVTVVLLAGALTSFLLAISYRIGRAAGFTVEFLMTYYVLAAGSLRDESMKVYDSLAGISTGGSSVEEARSALSMIVGRDTSKLSEAGIERAAVETVAENTSDGVIAPLIYTALGGPVLGFIYKAVNTMDSMIGYHNERYEYFGRFAARADDVANYIPSRLSAIFMIIAAKLCELFGRRSERSDSSVSSGASGSTGSYYSASSAFAIWKRDRRCHKSPNSAQTESVCAGALGLRLAGDAVYGNVLVKKPYIGDDTRPVEAQDIKRAIKLMFVTEAVCTAAIFTITVLILIFPSI